MRKPRLTDFQPEAAAPKLSSPMDDMPAIAKPAVPDAVMQPQSAIPGEPIEAPKTPAPVERPDGSTPAAPPERPYARTSGRRGITRYAFEFFQDQIVRLRHLSLEQKLQGEDGSMSEMVRAAVDAYLMGKEESRA